ncbi:ankyrin repeat-containing domain protein [Peziza echinospora]|nr:ankyrin repeat-containing domain protein [Peziza echinospora]
MASNTDPQDSAQHDVDASMDNPAAANLQSFNKNSFNKSVTHHNINNSVDNSRHVVTNNFNSGASKDYELNKMKKWLHPLDFGPEHSRNLRNWQPGTGQWFLDDEKYVDWRHGVNRVLICEGNPGAGKSTLVAMAINDMMNNHFRDNQDAIAYIYSTYQNRDQQSAIKLIESIAWQLAISCHSAFDILDKVYQRHNKGNVTQPAWTEWLTIINDEIQASELTNVFIFVDALDELKPSEKSQLLQGLNEIAKQANVVQILLMSRPMNLPASYFSLEPRLTISAQDVDIEAYIRSKISYLEDLDSVKHNASLVNLIIGEICNCAQGMFLLAVFHLKEIEAANSTEEVRNALAKLSLTHDSTYDSALQRIRNQETPKADLACLVILWVTFCAKPLCMTGLRYALQFTGKDVSSGPNVALEESALVFPQRILTVCGGLIIVDERSERVQLVHETAHVYFSKNSSLLNSTDTQPHSMLAKACMTFLCSSPCVYAQGRHGRPTVGNYSELQPTDKFFNYAFEYWDHHSRKALDCAQSQLPIFERTLVDFLGNLSQLLHLPSVEGEWFMVNEMHRTSNQDFCKIGVFASHFGLYQIVESSIKEQPIAFFHWWSSALDHAVHMGHRKLALLIMNMAIHTGAVRFIKSISLLDTLVFQNELDLVKLYCQWKTSVHVSKNRPHIITIENYSSERVERDILSDMLTGAMEKGQVEMALYLLDQGAFVQKISSVLEAAKRKDKNLFQKMLRRWKPNNQGRRAKRCIGEKLFEIAWLLDDAEEEIIELAKAIAASNSGLEFGGIDTSQCLRDLRLKRNMKLYKFLLADARIKMHITIYKWIFLLAITVGNHEIARSAMRCLSTGSDFTQTVLKTALLAGKDVVNLFLDDDIDIQTILGCGDLFGAFGDQHCALENLHPNCYPDTSNQHGLLCTATYNHLDPIIKTLLKYCHCTRSTHCPYFNGSNAIFEALENQDMRTVKSLLGRDVRETASISAVVLHAVVRRFESFLRLLLMDTDYAVVNVLDVSTDSAQHSILCYAVLGSNQHIVQLVLDYCVRVDCMGNAEDAIHHAILGGDAVILRLLLVHSARICPGQPIITAELLMEAWDRGHKNVVIVLLQHLIQAAGAAPSSEKSQVLNGILHNDFFVGISGHYSIPEDLENSETFDKEFFISLVDLSYCWPELHSFLGHTPSALLIAVRCGHESTVAALLQHGAEISAACWTQESSPLFRFGVMNNDTDLAKPTPEQQAIIIDKHQEPSSEFLRNLLALDEKYFPTVLQKICHVGDNILLRHFLENRSLAELEPSYLCSCPSDHFRFCNPVLYYAISSASVGIVKILLEHGADANGHWVYLGRKSRLIELPLLYHAVREDAVDIASLLLMYKADPNPLPPPALRAEIPYTPLFMAIQRNNYEMVALLLKHGARPNYTCSDDQNEIDENTTAYLSAAVQHSGNRGIVALLLEQGPDPNSPIRNERYSYGQDLALLCAVKMGLHDIVALLLDHLADPNTRGKDNEHVLYMAVRLGNHQIVSILLEHGADPNAFSGRENHLALNEAIAKGNGRIAGLLLRHKADPNKLSGSAKSFEDLPLLCALKCNSDATITGLLLAQVLEADCNLQFDGKNLLYHTVAMGIGFRHPHSEAFGLEILKRLLENRANDGSYADDVPALTLAASHRRDQELKILLEHNTVRPRVSAAGAPHAQEERLSIERRQQLTLVLSSAARFRNVAAVMLLLEHNANANGQSPEGKPILAIALEAGDPDIVKLLLENGADPEVEYQGDAALRHAIRPEASSTMNVKLLLSAQSRPMSTAGTSRIQIIDAAIHSGNIWTLRALFESGEVDISLVRMLAMLELAVACGQSAATEFLLSKRVLKLPAEFGSLLTLCIAAGVAKNVRRGSGSIMTDSAMVISTVSLLLRWGAPADTLCDRRVIKKQFDHVNSCIPGQTIANWSEYKLSSPQSQTYTPLSLALRTNHVELLALLLHWGAAVDATTYQWLKYSDHDDYSKKLLKRILQEGQQRSLGASGALRVAWKSTTQRVRSLYSAKTIVADTDL